MTMWMKLGGLTAIACMALTTAACGGDDDSVPPTSTAAAGENVVHIQAAITQAAGKVNVTFLVGQANTISVPGFDNGVAADKRSEKFILGNSIKAQITGGASADVVRVDDTKATLSIDAPTVDGDYTLTVGPAAGTTVTLVNLKTDRTTVDTQATLGQITLHFSRKGGNLVIPNFIYLAYPTDTTTKNLGAAFKGLPANSLVQAKLEGGNAAATLTKSSPKVVGNEANGVVIADLVGGITPSPNSKLTLTFVAP